MSRKKCLYFIILFFACTAWGLPVRAQYEAKGNPKSELKIIQSDIKEKTKKTENLKTEISVSKKELKATKSDILKLARSVQENETKIQELQKKISALEDKKSSLALQIVQDRRAFADIIMSLQRMKRTPAQALVMKPGATIDTARSAKLMQGILTDIEKKALAMTQAIQSLEDTTQSLLAEKFLMEKTGRELALQQETLGALLKKREEMFRTQASDLQAREADIRKAAEKAKTIQDLIDNLNAERTARILRDKTGKENASGEQSRSGDRIEVQIPKNGQARLPVTGSIEVGYNQINKLGAKSTAIEIRAPAGGLAVAPMGGIIAYTGAFNKYKNNIVIVQHKGGYYSLIAGLDKITAVEGQDVLAGEPIGSLKPVSSVVYYELLKNGHPVNPKEKIKF